MADNIELNAGSGGAIVAADDITSVWYQITKLAFGALGTATLVSASDPLPVSVLGDALTALQLIDNPVLVDDAAFTPATSSVMMAGFEFDDTLPDSVDEGDAGAARMSARREVYVQIRDAAGNERGANVNASGNLGVVEASAGSILTSVSATRDGYHDVDVNFGSQDTGVLALGVRDDALAANAGVSIDGDYVPLRTDNFGALWAHEAPSTDFEHFSNLDVDTLAEQLTAFACRFGVQVKADDDNSDSVYVGKSDVTAGTTDATDGFRLKAGQGVFLPVSNANLVYVIGGAINQKVYVLAV
jgi:hypothetical protein